MNYANMINRTHRRIDADCLAIYSDCEAYRYLLQIVWDESAPMAMFVMLNPSTATELANDPTVERCEIRARRGADSAGFVSVISSPIAPQTRANCNGWQTQSGRATMLLLRGTRGWRGRLFALGATTAGYWGEAKRCMRCYAGKWVRYGIWV